ncbi:MAG TPA: peptidase M48, partial [Flavobacteriaceae bacterium]|nr:peptidase M48 [Flavobacteriaceae bacterium]
MKIKTIIATGAVSLALVACVTNPITGRKSVQIVGNDQLSAMGVQEYQTALSKAKVITNTTDATRVKNVGIRIKNAATNYYKSIGREADLQGYNWEFNLLEDKQLNAWCMPGGKVA